LFVYKNRSILNFENEDRLNGHSPVGFV
jgi:hypothetical protein